MADKAKTKAVLADDLSGDPIQALKYQYGATYCQRVAFTDTAAQSAVIDADDDTVVTITPTQDCFFSVGADPTATDDSAGSDFLPKGAKWTETVPAGHKISFVQLDTAGAAYVKLSQ